MKTKVIALLILATIAVGVIGYSYACLNGGIDINCYCNCDVKFIKVSTSDNEFEKEVGNVRATISCDGDTITVCINNAYPCYRAYINFTIKNQGCRPVHIDGVTIGDYNITALDITLTGITGCWICPCECIKGQLTVHTLQEAQECHTYTFKVKIAFSCQEGYPRTIGFWKNQFDKSLCKGGNPQVPAATLEQYLNQISTQSPCFEFTGTRTQKFQQALNILSPPNNAIMKDKLKAQLLALWLNYMSGWTGGYKYGGKTDQQIILGSENVLKNGPASQYEYWKNMCDGFNNLGG
jgi:hypothetical protein